MILALSLALLGLVPARTDTMPQHKHDYILVSADFLKANLHEPQFVILHVTAPKMGDSSYRAGHIPGARELDVMSIVGPGGPGDKLSTVLLSPDSLRHVFENLGLKDDTHVVLYAASQSVTAVARTFLTLEYLGYRDRIHVLDGGYGSWLKAGGAVETKTQPHARTTLHLTPQNGVVVSGSWVHDHMNDPNISLVDARAPVFFNGTTLGHKAARTGHIPGAHNVFFATLVDSTTYMYTTPEQARATFAAAGVALNKPVVVYCHVGFTASADYLQLRRLGVPVSLYEGSFEDWSGNESYPVVKP
jgi:thiosulfate/3-mercaptopyruvate sulfurtransferase